MTEEKPTLMVVAGTDVPTEGPHLNAPPDNSNGAARSHAEAFRDLEGEICDLARWAELAGGLIRECACDKRSWRELELAVLVVDRLTRLTADFRDRYYRAWKDAPEGRS